MEYVKEIYRGCKESMERDISNNQGIVHNDKYIVSVTKTHQTFKVMFLVKELFKELDNIECEHYYKYGLSITKHTLVCKFPRPIPVSNVPRPKSSCKWA